MHARRAVCVHRCLTRVCGPSAHPQELAVHIITKMSPAASEAYVASLAVEKRALVEGVRLTRMFPKQRKLYLDTLSSELRLSRHPNLLHPPPRF